MAEKQFLSILEAAKFLSCSTQTIRRLIKKGALPAGRIANNHIRIAVEDLLDVLVPVIPGDTRKLPMHQKPNKDKKGPTK
ncbi:hypothetical protein LCGC14_1436000 [marine sediment metagenome]|uniref:Helix-turn-helix domain-containing protein n=1 Tax=marine sediment metagenome TaxID=412755 RepID=A0A0F9JMQ0_9ZZZZ